MSRVGRYFCVAYLVLIGLCLAWAFAADGDFKGQFVLLQAPIALQLGVLASLGFGPLLERLSWVAAYLLMVPPALVVAYFLGIFVERLWSRLPPAPQ